MTICWCGFCLYRCLLLNIKLHWMRRNERNKWRNFHSIVLQTFNCDASSEFIIRASDFLMNLCYEYEMNNQKLVQNWEVSHGKGWADLSFVRFFHSGILIGSCKKICTLCTLHPLWPNLIGLMCTRSFIVIATETLSKCSSTMKMYTITKAL